MPQHRLNIDNDLVLKYWDDGLSMTAIAREFKCSVSAIKHILTDKGITDFSQSFVMQRKYDKEADAQWSNIHADLESGFTISELMSKYGMTKVRLYMLFERHDYDYDEEVETVRKSTEDKLKSQLIAWRDDGKTVKEISLLLGKSERTTSRYLKEFGLTAAADRTDICDEDVIQYYNDGFTIAEIAVKCNCSHDTVTKRLNKYGIANNRGEGIHRHFERNYESRWIDIKADLDRGLSVSAVRDLHCIRMENLKELMQSHGYLVNTDVLYNDLLKRINEESVVTDKRRNCLKYLLVIKDYIDVNGDLPSIFSIVDAVGCHEATARQAVKRYNLCQFVKCQGISSCASVVRQYLQANNVNYEINNRKILLNENGHYQELDFYLTDEHIGIEVNPVGTHTSDLISIGITDKLYHQKKSLLAEQCGVPLVHLYNEDIVDIDRFEKIMNIILTNNKVKCGARDCILNSISASDANLFLNKYHLQGGENNSSYRYGLYYNAELCCVMTFGQPRYTKHDFEIIRYCVRPDFIVMGGFQKLFKHFVKNNCIKGTEIVSYMDLNKRFSVENIYEKAGFMFDGITQPDYMWVDKYGTKTLKRYETTKQKLIEQGFDASKSEREIMESQGFYRVYGAGSKRYVYYVR